MQSRRGLTLVLSRAACAACLVLLCSGARHSALATAASGAVGYDYYSGPNGQQTHAGLGIAVLGVGSGDLLAGALRFDDNIVGPGSGVLLGGGVPLGERVKLRMLGTRFVGDRDYRAWRLKIGPQWSAPAGGVLGAFYIHDSNNLGPDTRSGTGELSVPLSKAWAGKFSLSYGRCDEVSGFASTVGAEWTPVPHVGLSADLGFARNPPGTTVGPAAPGGGVLQSILGTGHASGAERTDEKVTGTTSVSLRVTFP